MVTATIQQQGDAFALSGSITFDSVVALTTSSQQLLTAGQPAILDFAQLENSNSATGAYLLEMSRHTNSQLQIRNMPTQMNNWFEVTGLNALLHTQPA